MNFLFGLLFLGAALCQAETLIGYVSINNKLLSNIVSDSSGSMSIQVGLNELFAISLATTSPLRWFLFTPNAYPYLICRQNIVDKNARTNEVLQLFGCKMLYQGNTYITLTLGTGDIKIQPSQKHKIRIEVSSSFEKVGIKLTQELPKTVPTIPPTSDNYGNNQNSNVNTNINTNNFYQNNYFPYGFPPYGYNGNNGYNQKDYGYDYSNSNNNQKDNYNNDYRTSLKDFFSNMMDRYDKSDYYTDDYWYPSKYRNKMRRNQRHNYDYDYGFDYDDYDDYDDYWY